MGWSPGEVNIRGGVLSVEGSSTMELMIVPEVVAPAGHRPPVILPGGIQQPVGIIYINIPKDQVREFIEVVRAAAKYMGVEELI